MRLRHASTRHRADLPHVHYLRSLTDCDALIAGAKNAKHAVVIGASFIGLEVAASLRTRKLDIEVVGPEAILMEKVLSAKVGGFIRRLHEQHGQAVRLTKPMLGEATFSGLECPHCATASAASEDFDRRM